jgi:glycosyltransferase involved in cell wall biosynthesis
MRHHRLFYGSAYDRGLQHLLEMWPQIIERFPDVTLDIAYGWDIFDVIYANDHELMSWKSRINDLMKQPGILHRGRISKEELRSVRTSCGIWAYPTHSLEINCITALECQRDGCVPCVTNFAALRESVQAGLKVEGDIYEEETQIAYLEALFLLLEDKKLWKEEQRKGQEWARSFDWSLIAEKWDEHFRL